MHITGWPRTTGTGERIEMTHLVSVIVPIYNSEDTISGCVENILNQTYKNVEILLVVDSKTTDSSLDVSKRVASEHDNISVLVQTNKDRMSGARNDGITASKGDIICFLDADDYQYPNYLEEMIRIMDDTGSDMVFCNHYHMFTRDIPEVPETDYPVIEYEDHSIVSQFTSVPVYPWARIQKRWIFDSGEAFFYNHPSSEDIEQVIRSIVISNKVCFYTKPLCVYYKHEGSATGRCRCTDAESIESIAERMIPFVREKLPDRYPGFRKGMIERVMRQIAFASYHDYKPIYKNSIAHELIKETKDRTTEMKVFAASGLLYYMILYSFTHRIWDAKKGLWAPIPGK